MCQQTAIPALFPLTVAQPARPMRVVRIAGGREVRGRLTAMGLTPGMPIKVAAGGGGPLILDVLGGPLILARGMAAKVLVAQA